MSAREVGESQDFGSSSSLGSTVDSDFEKEGDWKRSARGDAEGEDRSRVS